MYYVYILECSDSSLYAGYTNDLDNRLKVHNQGKGAKYTRGRLPVKLLYSEAIEDKSDALKREYKIKQMTRKQKEELIKGNNKILTNIN